MSEQLLSQIGSGVVNPEVQRFLDELKAWRERSEKSDIILGEQRGTGNHDKDCLERMQRGCECWCQGTGGWGVKKYTRADVACKWKIHTWPDKPTVYYIGPMHGRLSVADYKTRNEAQIALEIQRWIVKMFKLKPTRAR